MAYEESGYSQREFARRTHTSVALLNDVISGRNQMTIRYARKIEETLGVGADWLLYGDESAKEYPCSESMIKFLKGNPDVREEVWKKMKEREDSRNSMISRSPTEISLRAPNFPKSPKFVVAIIVFICYNISTRKQHKRLLLKRTPST